MNETTPIEKKSPRWLRLVARIWSAPVILITLFITIGNIWAWLTNAPGDPYAVEDPSFLESLPPALLAIAVLGLALAWRWEKLGGIFSLIFSGAALIVLFIQTYGSDNLSRLMIPSLLTAVISVPGILFLIYGFQFKGKDSAD